MHLKIRHRTVYRYEPAALRVALRMKLFPARTSSQNPLSWAVTVNGETHSPPITNGFGDQEAIWVRHSEVSEVEVIAEGEIETRDTSGILKNWRMAARPSLFLRSTPLTMPEEPVQALAEAARGGLTGLDLGHAVSAAVRDAVAYTPGATTSTTSAAEALRGGAGVCQDHSHIFIAAMRALGAPARYVTGYLYTGDEEDSLIVEGETHAWAETWIEDLGWVGFDPSNRICPTASYVRLAAGLDAAEASPLRGSVTGDTSEDLEADVAVVAAQQ